jgi:hypothetical protein
VSHVSRIHANALLCDSAQVVGGKLYILGGGWQYLWVQPGNTVAFSVAIDLVIPWDHTNRQLNLAIAIVTEDGEQVVPDGAEVPVRAEGQLVVGRPPQARPGADLHTPVVIPFANVPLAPGGYACVLTVDGETISTLGFQIAQVPSAPGEQP